MDEMDWRRGRCWRRGFEGLTNVLQLSFIVFASHSVERVSGGLGDALLSFPAGATNTDNVESRDIVAGFQMSRRTEPRSAIYRANNDVPQSQLLFLETRGYSPVTEKVFFDISLDPTILTDRT